MYNGFVPYYAPNIATGGLLGTLKKFSWGSFLTNTQKTLSVVNQAIPLVYQVKPIINNARTVLKVIGAVKEDDTNIKTNNNNNNNSNNSTTTNNSYNQTNQPNFFL